MGNSQANIVKTQLAYRDLRFCSPGNTIDDRILFCRGNNGVSFLGYNKSCTNPQLRFTLKASVQSQSVRSDRVSGPKSSARAKSVRFFSELLFPFCKICLLECLGDIFLKN